MDYSSYYKSILGKYAECGMTDLQGIRQVIQALPWLPPEGYVLLCQQLFQIPVNIELLTKSAECQLLYKGFKNNYNSLKSSILTQREIHVLERVYGIDGGAPTSMHKVSQQFNVSVQAIRQARSNAEHKLRQNCDRFFYCSTGYNGKYATVRVKEDSEMKRGATNLSIDSLNLSHRVNNCLIRSGINTVSDLVTFINVNGGIHSLGCIRNFGVKSQEEVASKLYSLGLLSQAQLNDFLQSKRKKV